MQQSHRVMLAGGHEKHFDFLPGGEILLKKSGLREVYFYVWLYRVAGKSLLHTASIETFLEELHCHRKSAAATFSFPDECFSPITGDTQAKTGVRAQNLTGHPPSTTPSDEALWRTLLIPRSSGSRDDFEKFSPEYHRQARALLPWLPFCLGTVERIHVSPSSTCVNQNIPNEASCQSATTAAHCPKTSASSERPAVVMENLLQGLSKPAVLDTKLGTKYYGEEVSAAKREKEAQYARERGTHEVGMAFCGYFCGSPSEKNSVSVSGGSRASNNFKHPKTVEAFSRLFQQFLMLQGDVRVAIRLGRFFARRISELILLCRSAREKPLVNFFGTSVLLIYDAGGRDVENAAGGEQTEAAKNLTSDAEPLSSGKEADEVKLGRNMKDVAGGKEEVKEVLVVKTAEDTAVTLANAEKQNAVQESTGTAGRVSDEQKTPKDDAGIPQLTKSGSRGNSNCKWRLIADDISPTRGSETAKGGVPCTSSDFTAKGGSARKSGEDPTRGSTCSQADGTDLRSVSSTLLNATVKIVDFAHVIVLPQQPEEGFIFGLQNFQVALDLATQSLENTQRSQFHAAS